MSFLLYSILNFLIHNQRLIYLYQPAACHINNMITLFMRDNYIYIFLLNVVYYIKYIFKFYLIVLIHGKYIWFLSCSLEFEYQQFWNLMLICPFLSDCSSYHVGPFSINKGIICRLWFHLCQRTIDSLFLLHPLESPPFMHKLFLTLIPSLGDSLLKVLAFLFDI